ncbi:MAG: hypothetical protein QOJ52_2584 [Acidimicrobiaceae bacterium]|nr:hypothetical protein [Acidimicrobiaceae bacterium]MDQ1376383.1 hypothetical protein [Acidimicrobiaceae bacterium]MDQ1416366.1 hypothetical protein [Acidimicrobiaceae bacterium]MDQ1420622.1 hypothetical protein [Acidimicrobiaceae bacterium]MDQ1442477.1 hypothetical protein [Acidimicrobiaceae bacterium]
MWPVPNSLGCLDPIRTVLTAAGVFAGTNIDDIIVLTMLFLSARASGQPKVWQVWAGQYTGIVVLVLLSAGAALGLTTVPDNWVGLLGLVPFTLGLRGLVIAVRSRGHNETPVPAVARGLAAVVGVTIANGADNVSAYVPMFRSIGVTRSLVAVAVFMVLVAVWCLAGSWLGSHEKVIGGVQRSGYWIVPSVFVLIGAVILVESGVIGRLAS